MVLFDELNSRDLARDNNNYQLLRIATGGNSYCHKLEIFRQAKRNIFAKIFGIFDNLEYHGILTNKPKVVPALLDLELDIFVYLV